MANGFVARKIAARTRAKRNPKRRPVYKVGDVVSWTEGPQFQAELANSFGFPGTSLGYYENAPPRTMRLEVYEVQSDPRRRRFVYMAGPPGRKDDKGGWSPYIEKELVKMDGSRLP